ncbi:class D beta-lactamase [Burkholderia cepacia]|uniref:class D beta-lactamase n=1 Tax=Burkholderia cepacia TaxID=292 RepID=UPI00398EC902
MNRRRFLLASFATAAVSSGAFAAATDGETWGKYFTEANAQGTLVVADLRGGKEVVFVHDRERAAQRLSPASTFKIPHSLIALDAGVLRDEFQIIPWDGVKRPIDAWNRDQDLRSAVRNSAVWVFERFAKEIGREKEAAYMRKIPYGNALSSGAEPFWVDGDLAISAQEQIAFLRRLYNNTLPFRVEHQLIVKDVLINEADRDWILRAKSGWSGKIGWWVGWVEWPDGPVFFALNIDTPNRMEDLPKREKIVRQVLRSLDALPG